jgi:hypothetical protein
MEMEMGMGIPIYRIRLSVHQELKRQIPPHTLPTVIIADTSGAANSIAVSWQTATTQRHSRVAMPLASLHDSKQRVTDFLLPCHGQLTVFAFQGQLSELLQQ